MSDIRKRIGAKGTTYQVRFPSNAAKSGYAYATFDTLKEARAFREDSKARKSARPRSAEVTTVDQGIQRWLDVCEHEGRDGRDPVSSATLAVYKGCASIMRGYDWGAQLHELEATDLAGFRSWLLKEYTRDQAKRTLSCFHSMLIEMVTQGVLATDPAARITIQRSRYKEPVEIPSIAEIQSILAAADRLANHKYKYHFRAMAALPRDDLSRVGLRLTPAGIPWIANIQSSGKGCPGHPSGEPQQQDRSAEKSHCPTLLAHQHGCARNDQALRGTARGPESSNSPRSSIRRRQWTWSSVQWPESPSLSSLRRSLAARSSDHRNGAKTVSRVRSRMTRITAVAQWDSLARRRCAWAASDHKARIRWTRPIGSPRSSSRSATP
jgi:hypothetical protein